MTTWPIRNGTSSYPRRVLRAFTLVELLVVVSITALLVGMILPALSGARSAARATVEMSGAQQMMMAFTMRAEANRGKVLPGYPPASGPYAVTGVKDDTGAPLEGLAARRYPWRLLPYLEYNIAGLYPDEGTVRAMQKHDRDGFIYRVSITPSLGLNQAFVGGSSDKGEDQTGQAFNPNAHAVWGKNWFVDSLNDPPRPAELITFASAYSSLSYTGYEPVDGFYKVIPPYFIDRYWYERPTESTTIEDIARMGYVQYRYSNRAVVGFFDSHADMLGWEEMQDMRHWAPQADRPDWVLPR